MRIEPLPAEAIQLRQDIYDDLFETFCSRSEESVETQCRRLTDKIMKHVRNHDNKNNTL